MKYSAILCVLLVKLVIKIGDLFRLLFQLDFLSLDNRVVFLRPGTVQGLEVAAVEVVRLVSVQLGLFNG